MTRRATGISDRNAEVDVICTLSVQSLCTTYTSNSYSLSILRRPGEPVEAMSWGKFCISFPFRPPTS
jgi:hypothetical protein